MDNQTLEKMKMVVDGLRAYHRHEVVGLQHIPNDGRGLIVSTHSLATYDIALLFGAVYDHNDRLVRPLVDHLFYKIPYLGELVEYLGCRDGSLENARKLLQANELVGVAPGGMREALRPSDEKYKILWKRRKGFIKLAIETQTPIIIAVCPQADDLYEVFPNFLTKLAYDKFRIPIFLAKGFGFTPLPRPVKLVHHIARPIKPPVARKTAKAFARQVDELHDKVILKTEQLIAKAIGRKELPASSR